MTRQSFTTTKGARGHIKPKNTNYRVILGWYLEEWHVGWNFI